MRHLRAAFAEREVIEVGKYGEDISEEVMKQISEKEREIRMVRTENKSKLWKPEDTPIIKCSGENESKCFKPD